MTEGFRRSGLSSPTRLSRAILHRAIFGGALIDVTSLENLTRENDFAGDDWTSGESVST